MKSTYPKFSCRHQRVLKWLLDHPEATLTACAKANGYSRSWLSRIVNNPEFRQRHSACLNTALLQSAQALLVRGRKEGGQNDL